MTKRLRAIDIDAASICMEAYAICMRMRESRVCLRQAPCHHLILM
jgi:hypothetical protein